VSKIGRTLHDGTRLLWIFQTVAMAEYFHGPRNSITTALHCGKCQYVFKDGVSFCYCAYVLRISRYSSFLHSRSQSLRSVQSAVGSQGPGISHYPISYPLPNIYLFIYLSNLSISYPESTGFLVSGWSLTKKPVDSGYEIGHYTWPLPGHPVAHV